MSSLPIDGLKDLFRSASSAARRAQHYLDSRSPEGPYAWYAIPRVSVEMTVTLTQGHDGLFRVILGRKSKEEFTQRLGFTLVSTPFAPEAPGRSAGAATDVTLPPFLVKPADRPRVARLVEQALQHKIPFNGRFADDPGTTDFSREFSIFVRTLHDPKHDESVVFLQVGADPVKYLVVRIGDGGISHGRDGVYLVQPGAAEPVFIYSFLGSSQEFIWYEPFAMLTAALRDWTAGRLPPVSAAVADLPSLGGISPFDVGAALLSSYRQAGAEAEPAPALPGAPPVIYSVHDVGATLGYGVSASHEETSPYIQSMIGIQVGADQRGSVRMNVGAPEFLLSGDALAQFLDALNDSIQGDDPLCNGILKADASYAQDYCRALRDPARQRSALLFLSYRDQPPKPEFLAVWTGVISGADPEEERDFAFTCQAGEHGLEKFKIAFPLEDPVPNSITGLQKPFSEAMLSRDAYVAFHNFIHAVRIWDLRAGWITPQEAA